MTGRNDFRPSRRGVLGFALAGAVTAGLGVRAAQAARVATKARIIIIGAGAGGTALANRLVQRLDGAQITLIDPRAQHLYQPGLSLVAGGRKPAR
ncbi:FAD-dependent oxidoreductase [Paracoccus pantotrophus]|uniref:FAD-dependent oxidoreductase n=1 Tax=Paracoccus pantotrophus TaxID=82367 RepID=UPI0035AF32C2